MSTCMRGIFPSDQTQKPSKGSVIINGRSLACGHFIRAPWVWRTFQHQRYIRNELPGWCSCQGFVGNAHCGMKNLVNLRDTIWETASTASAPWSFKNIHSPCCTWRVHSKKLTTSVLICVNPQAFLLWNAWKVKNWFMWTTHLIYYIKYIFQNRSLQSPWNRRAYLGLSREAKAESVIHLLSSFKHGQEGSGEGPIILKDLSGQCWERSHATQRKPEFWSIKSALLHFCSLVLTWHILLHAHHAWKVRFISPKKAVGCCFVSQLFTWLAQLKITHCTSNLNSKFCVSSVMKSRASVLTIMPATHCRNVSLESRANFNHAILPVNCQSKRDKCNEKR